MNNIIVEQAAEKFKAPQPMPSIPADIKAATAEEEEESEDEEVCFLFLRGKYVTSILRLSYSCFTFISSSTSELDHFQNVAQFPKTVKASLH